MNNDILLEFSECAACRQKRGSPDLCQSCVQNRWAISRLESMVAEARLITIQQQIADYVRSRLENHDDLQPVADSAAMMLIDIICLLDGTSAREMRLNNLRWEGQEIGDWVIIVKKVTH